MNFSYQLTKRESGSRREKRNPIILMQTTSPYDFLFSLFKLKLSKKFGFQPRKFFENDLKIIRQIVGDGEGLCFRKIQIDSVLIYN